MRESTYFSRAPRADAARLAVFAAALTFAWSGNAQAQTSVGALTPNEEAAISRLGTAERWARELGGDAGRLPGAVSRIYIVQPEMPRIAQAAYLSDVDFAGATPKEISRLTRALEGDVGERLTPERLSQLLEKLNNIQAQEGVPLRTVYAPPQEIENGTLTLVVATGRFAELNIKGAALDEEQALRFLAEQELSVFLHANIETFAERAAETLGRPIRLAVAPAGSPGGAVITLDASPTVFSFEFDFDNQAPVFVSRENFSAEIIANSLLRAGDKLTLNGFATTDFQQSRFYRFKYDYPLFNGGPTLIVGAGLFQLDPGIDFLRDRGFEIESNFASAHLKQSLWDKSAVSVALKSGILRRDVTRQLTTAPLANNVIWSADISVDFQSNHDRWGDTELTLVYRRSVDIFDASPVDAPDTLRRGLGSGQTAWQINFEHEVELLPDTVLKLAMYKQMATGPLIGPEQCQYGGDRFGLGYDPVELNGDACILAAAVLEHTPDALRFGRNSMTLIAVADYGSLKLQSAPDPNAPVIQALQSERESIAAGVKVSFGERNSMSFLLARPLVRSTVPGLENNDFRYMFGLKAQF